MENLPPHSLAQPQLTSELRLLRKCRISLANFNDYSVLLMPEAPALETYFIENHDEPHGLGEAAVWLTGPAIANAIFAATGRRLRRMPFRMDETLV